MERSLYDVIRTRDREVGFQDRVPWPTFILGSGALATYSRRELTADQSEAEFAALAVRIREALTAQLHPSFAQRIDAEFAPRTEQFIRALAERKLGPTASLAWLTEPGSSVASARETQDFAVVLTCIAVLATRVYTEALNATTSVLDRAEKDEVAYRVDASLDSRLVRAHEDLVLPLRQIIEGLDAEWGDDESQARAAALSLLHDFARGLGSWQVHVHRTHVEILTAFAWYFLTEETDIYPGWADILLFQAANMPDAKADFAALPLPRRPRLRDINPLDESSWLYRRLRRVTERSWEDAESARDEFYGSVARLMIQQAELVGRGAETMRDDRWPLVSSFVVSFDVELEIALLHRMDDDAEGIVVVIPVLRTEGDADRPFNTTIHWLYRIVAPVRGGDWRDDLNRLLDESDWRVLSSPSKGLDAFKGLPIVVHLSGAPLFKLPSADAAGIRRGTDRRGNPLPEGVLRHAIVLDENMALFQLAAEARDPAGRLHPDLSASTEWDQGTGPGPRFWTIVGAQLADPGVRLRLLTRELMTEQVQDRKQRAEHAHHDGGSDGGARTGVIVNEWSPGAERQVFAWQGLDVVKGRSDELQVHLDRLYENIARDVRITVGAEG